MLKVEDNLPISLAIKSALSNKCGEQKLAHLISGHLPSHFLFHRNLNAILSTLNMSSGYITQHWRKYISWLSPNVLVIIIFPSRDEYQTCYLKPTCVEFFFVKCFFTWKKKVIICWLFQATLRRHEKHRHNKRRSRSRTQRHLRDVRPNRGTK